MKIRQKILSSTTVLCKSNANEIRRKSSFVSATFLRKVIEFSKDVLKGCERKNHDLPRKFERTKFKVANFPGDQTTIRDTKFKATNCCKHEAQLIASPTKRL